MLLYTKKTSQELLFVVFQYVLILFLTVIGNWLLIKFIKRAKIKHLKNKFIVAFACTDLLTSLIFLPIHLFLEIIKTDKYDFICKLDYFVISLTTIQPVQFMLLVAISQYHYTTGKMKWFFKKSRVNITIRITFFISLSFAFLESFSAGIEHKGKLILILFNKNSNY